jgi:hypothetical protein
VVAQRTGDTVRLVVNDYEVGSMTFSGSLWTSPGPVRFGSADPMVDCFKGLIDEVRITAVPRFPPATSTADASGNGNDGALRGTAAIVTGGQTGGALRVGGCGSGAEVPASESLVLGASGFTIEAWVRPELVEPGDLSGGRVLAGPGFELALWASGPYTLWPCFTVSGESGSAYAYGYPGISAGQWYHVVMQRSDDVVRLFVNGEELWPGLFPGPLSATPVPLQLGSTEPTVPSFYGLLDEVRIATVTPGGFPVTPDASGNGNDAQLRRHWQLLPQGKAGSAFLSAYYGGYADVPPSVTLALGANDFDIEAWINPWWYVTEAAIVGKWAGGNEYVLRLSGGRLALDLSSDGTEATRTTIVGNTVVPMGWTHVAARRRGETVTLYVNGEADGSGMFAGTVYSGGAPLRIGVVDPSAGPYFTGGIDELSISVTEPPPPATHASIYIPGDFDPEVADTIHYFHGLRDATAADPAFTEAETETASLVFRGTFQGVDTAIAIDPATFTGLTGNVDSLRATVSHTFGDGHTMPLTATFTETGAETGVFRAQFEEVLPQEGGGLGAWSRQATNLAGSNSGSSRPFTVRLLGLTEDASNRYAGTFGGPQFEWSIAEDGWWYLLSASKPLVHLVREEECPGLFKVKQVYPSPEGGVEHESLNEQVSKIRFRVVDLSSSYIVSGMEVPCVWAAMDFTPAMRVVSHGGGSSTRFIYPSALDLEATRVSFRGLLSCRVSLPPDIPAERVVSVTVQVAQRRREGKDIVEKIVFEKVVWRKADPWNPENVGAVPRTTDPVITFTGVTSSFSDRKTSWQKWQQAMTYDADDKPNGVNERGEPDLNGEWKYLDPGPMGRALFTARVTASFKIPAKAGPPGQGNQLTRIDLQDDRDFYAYRRVVVISHDPRVEAIATKEAGKELILRRHADLPMDPGDFLVISYGSLLMSGTFNNALRCVTPRGWVFSEGYGTPYSIELEAEDANDSNSESWGEADDDGHIHECYTGFAGNGVAAKIVPERRVYNITAKTPHQFRVSLKHPFSACGAANSPSIAKTLFEVLNRGASSVTSVDGAWGRYKIQAAGEKYVDPADPLAVSPPDSVDKRQKGRVFVRH